MFKLFFLKNMNLYRLPHTITFKIVIWGNQKGIEEAKKIKKRRVRGDKKKYDI